MSVEEQLTKLTDTYENIELLISVGERFKDQFTDPELDAIDETVMALYDITEGLWAKIKARLLPTDLPGSCGYVWFCERGRVQTVEAPPEPEEGTAMDIKTFCQESYRIAQERGFQRVQDGPLVFPTKAMLIVTEIAEMIEAHRAGRLLGPDGVVMELADIWIRLASFTAGVVEDINTIGLDEFIETIQHKMDYNESRPHKHGKRY